MLGYECRAANNKIATDEHTLLLGPQQHHTPHTHQKQQHTHTQSASSSTHSQQSHACLRVAPLIGFVLVLGIIGVMIYIHDRCHMT